LDGNLIKARPDGREGIGFVGEVTSMDVKILESLVKVATSPVSSVAADETGQAYNINADTVAGELAAALEQKIDFADGYSRDLEGLQRPIYSDRQIRYSRSSSVD
jgi:acetylglutamate kinase